MTKNILPFIIAIISLSFIACPSNNLPEWMDWQSEDVKILFYKIENETAILQNKLEKPELKAEWLLNFETGETKIY